MVESKVSLVTSLEGPTTGSAGSRVIKSHEPPRVFFFDLVGSDRVTIGVQSGGEVA